MSSREQNVARLICVAFYVLMAVCVALSNSWWSVGAVAATFFSTAIVCTYSDGSRSKPEGERHEVPDRLFCVTHNQTHRRDYEPSAECDMREMSYRLTLTPQAAASTGALPRWVTVDKELGVGRPEGGPVSVDDSYESVTKPEGTEVDG